MAKSKSATLFDIHGELMTTEGIADAALLLINEMTFKDPKQGNALHCLVIAMRDKIERAKEIAERH